MKTLITLILTLLTITVFSQATATLNITATIVDPVSISQTNNSIKCDKDFTGKINMVEFEVPSKTIYDVTSVYPNKILNDSNELKIDSWQDDTSLNKLTISVYLKPGNTAGVYNSEITIITNYN